MSAPVFLASPAELASLAAGQSFTLGGTEGHHAAVVQRRGVGERIDIVDGAGRRARTTVTEVRGKELVVQVGAIVEEPAGQPNITIVQGLIKSGGEEAVAMMTEVGVDHIIPWQSSRSIAKWNGERGEKARQKWQAAAREAAKQSRRSHIPKVRDVVQNKGLTDLLERASADGAAVLIAHEEATESLATALERTEGSAVWCVIGPEGGISDSELEDFRAAGGRLVSLGDHVLRAQTAGTTATVLLRALSV